jgi:hypothetical protein
MVNEGVEKIDLVITFVDMSDKEWANGYNDFIKTHDIPIPEINNVEVRSRDYGTLKCLLRSIDLYAPWINNVFLVVQRDSQVPKWINRNNVKVVLHEEFIPKVFLPTYNTFTIQAHIHKIPNLSEKFIFSDDDSILTKSITPEDFFIEDKLVATIVCKNDNKIEGSSSKHSHKFKKGASDVPKRLCGVINEYTYQDDHSMQPNFKKLNEELYNKIDIKKHVSSFREVGNIFRFSYLTYSYFKRRVIVVPSRNAYFDFKNRDIHQLRNWLVNAQFKGQLSINDQDLKDEFDKELYYEMVEETLQQLFPKKSKKYEI